MAIVTAADLEQIAAIRAEILADRPASLAFRRGDTTLAAQTVRIARLKNASRSQTEAGREWRGGVMVVGAPDLDVAVDDRFTLEGSLYRVTFVRPNRDTGTQAECNLVQ